MPHVFISYRRDGAENQRWAERIHQHLDNANFPVWRDVDGIQPGERWNRKIPPALDVSSIVLCVVTESLHDSDWIDAELNYAQSQKILVVPVQVDEIYRPLFLLSGVEPLRMHTDDTHAWQGLTRLVERHTARFHEAAGNSRLDRRERELAYLDGLLYTQKRAASLAPLYTALAGVGQTRAGLAKALPPDMMPVSFRHEREDRRFEDVLKVLGSEYRGETGPRLVLLGEPGAGKSFSLRRLAAQVGHIARDDPEAPIPLLAELGDWIDPGQAFSQFLATTIGALGGDLKGLFTAGRASLFLDGLNEIPTAHQAHKIPQIKQFLNDHRLAGTVVSCRERNYRALPDSLRLALDTVTIEPLDPPRIYVFVQRYLRVIAGEDPEREGDALFWRLASGDPASSWRVEEAATAWKSAQDVGITDFGDFWDRDSLPESLGDDLRDRLDATIRSIEADRRSLLGLAENPYLLNILLGLYLSDRLPAPGENRVTVFERFVDDLLQRERERFRAAGEITGARAAKAVETEPPGEPGLLDALGELAWNLQQSSLEHENESVQTRLLLASPAMNLTPAQQDHAVAANLLEVSATHVSFSHQLLQEYFAALGLKAKIDEQSISADTLFSGPEWWAPTGWEEVVRTMTGLYAENPAPLVEWLADTNPELLADSLRYNGLANVGTQLLVERSRDWIKRMTDPTREPDPALRAALGRTVGMLDLDNRPGVGLDGRDLPDIDWIEVPAGPFLFGEDKKPREMPTFHIARYPVTNAQYQAFIDAGGYGETQWCAGFTAHKVPPEDGYWTEPNRPRETVSWYQAVAFCRWLSAQLGYEVRLPTEVEWEKAARWTDGREYPWGDGYRSGHANVDETRENVGSHFLGQTTAVGMFPHARSPYDVDDLSGNVWEWCLNEYHQPDRNKPGGTEPRVLRGGSWFHDPDFARSSDRVRFDPVIRSGFIGFRVMCSSPMSR